MKQDKTSIGNAVPYNSLLRVTTKLMWWVRIEYVGLCTWYLGYCILGEGGLSEGARVMPSLLRWWSLACQPNRVFLDTNSCTYVDTAHKICKFAAAKRIYKSNIHLTYICVYKTETGKWTFITNQPSKFCVNVKTRELQYLGNSTSDHRN